MSATPSRADLRAGNDLPLPRRVSGRLLLRHRDADADLDLDGNVHPASIAPTDVHSGCVMGL